ncbi:uncharacterized protein [Acropora muricata]|uniref:uncharacterized protein n=1 Tax=Acropora muricata TaxID=159855 RepID=UPI0034E4503E
MTLVGTESLHESYGYLLAYASFDEFAVFVLLVCTNLLFSQRGNAITGPQGCGTTSKSKPINIHVHCSAQEKGCGTTSKSKPINIHVHCSAQEKSADKSSAEV